MNRTQAAAEYKAAVSARRILEAATLADFTEEELHIVRALKKLKHASNHPAELISLAFKSFWGGKEMPKAYQERLGLADAHSFKDTVVRQLLAGNL